MANNPYINKVIYNGNTLLDLTADTVTKDKVLEGFTLHDATGELVTGTCTYDADTSDATATVSEVLTGKTYYKQGSKLTGTMPNNGAVTGTISTKAQEYTVPTGFHDGSGKVKIDSLEQSKIIDSNIKSGITILGVLGTYTGEEITAETKTVNASPTQQTILPSSGYDYLAQVTVNAVPYVETDNQAGGKTVTIF